MTVRTAWVMAGLSVGLLAWLVPATVRADEPAGAARETHGTVLAVEGHLRAPTHAPAPPAPAASRSLFDLVGPLVLGGVALLFVGLDVGALASVGTSADRTIVTSLDTAPFVLNLVVAGVAALLAVAWWMTGAPRDDAAAPPPGDDNGQAGAANVI